MSVIYVNIKSIAAALRGDVLSPVRALVPGPGHSPSDRSLSIKLVPTARDGFVLHSFANDDFRSCRDYVLATIGSFPVQQQAQTVVAKQGSLTTSTSERAMKLWNEAVAPEGTLVEQYLLSRKLTLPPNSGASIRFHEACPFGPNKRLPCMIALYRDIKTDEARAILRTALTVDGRKIDRKVLGQKSGCAVKLRQACEFEGPLTIGEGIETTLAGIAYGFSPAWAVGDAGALARFPIIGGITRLHILVDYDESGVGESSAEQCSQRWTAAGVEVQRIIPAVIGQDMADLLGRAV
jgi:putative DNA primase/helicase